MSEPTSNQSSSKTILKAVKYAAECHRDQRRKDQFKTPYINHPVEVAEFLANLGVTDVNTLVGCILHDVLEDTDGTEQQISDLFGDVVLRIVLDCSDDKSLDKIQRKRLQISHAEDIRPEAKLVKLADKYSNISGLLTHPPTSWSEEEIKGYVHWGMAVCRNLYGVNETVDNELRKLFSQHGVDVNMSQTELEKHLEAYYKVIDKSE
ncbi:putative guanosine-3' 5'-bis(diphosphate) 3'-pyrophosphohydrolase MESH1 [Yasminevirus sp. GU-2018]|uniref:Putative guanosine-3' 5'-bis(Diphosphate) 3'-pyrophosphohydrolase MESH1 n=1 Tax=Yasminevirus sp. GU-2018 TaxID=2420051 RepID=A0A5K0U9K5_9VIRU|nr:putative guanosine-3' 5'-bis(diphosphate) 3'-pyrophosphohydrolase MESH1 [Yasminevirus sp. GU-2018]